MLALLASGLASAVDAQALPPLGGDAALLLAADSAEIRARRYADFLSAPRDAALARPRSVERDDDGNWLLRSERLRDHFYLILSPERDGVYPIYAQGSWILKRRISDGAFVSAKLFLRSDPATFLILKPDGGRTRLDLVAYGGVLRTGVPIPLPFERALVTPLSELVRASADLVEWQLFSPEPSLYSGVRELVAKARAVLPALAYAEDGALDADGSWIRLADAAPQTGTPGLNCSGFAKWIVDGLLIASRGSPSSVAEIKDLMRAQALDLELRGTSFSKAFESALEPYYGLDFTRALGVLASRALSPQRSVGASALGSDVFGSADVGLAPPAWLVRAGEPVNGMPDFDPYPDRFADSGYRVDGLRPILFLLASREPGSIYLAAFSRSDPKASTLRRWYHIAVLAPYFDESGIFRVATLESAAETGLAKIESRAAGDFVHLVRIPASGGFLPMEAPAAGAQSRSTLAESIIP